MKPVFTISEAQKSIRKSLVKHKIDTLHGWVVLSMLADSPIMRDLYDETVKNMGEKQVEKTKA